jgi:hypothetical protein
LPPVGGWHGDIARSRGEDAAGGGVASLGHQPLFLEKIAGETIGGGL